MRKVIQYLSHYAPGAGEPVFEDGDMFKVVVPLAAAEVGNATPQDTPPESGAVRALRLLQGSL